MKWLAIAFALAALGGCKKKNKDEAPPPATTGSATAMGSGSATAPQPPPAAGSAAGSAVDVPTEQDFEAKAATDITDKNVDSKLKTIEGDLGNQ